MRLAVFVVLALAVPLAAATPLSTSYYIGGSYAPMWFGPVIGKVVCGLDPGDPSIGGACIQAAPGATGVYGYAQDDVWHNEVHGFAQAFDAAGAPCNSISFGHAFTLPIQQGCPFVHIHVDILSTKGIVRYASSFG